MKSKKTGILKGTTSVLVFLVLGILAVNFIFSKDIERGASEVKFVGSHKVFEIAKSSEVLGAVFNAPPVSTPNSYLGSNELVLTIPSL